MRWSRQSILLLCVFGVGLYLLLGALGTQPLPGSQARGALTWFDSHLQPRVSAFLPAACGACSCSGSKVCTVLGVDQQILAQQLHAALLRDFGRKLGWRLLLHEGVFQLGDLVHPFQRLELSVRSFAQLGVEPQSPGAGRGGARRGWGRVASGQGGGRRLRAPLMAERGQGEQVPHRWQGVGGRRQRCFFPSISGLDRSLLPAYFLTCSQSHLSCFPLCSFSLTMFWVQNYFSMENF